MIVPLLLSAAVCLSPSQQSKVTDYLKPHKSKFIAFYQSYNQDSKSCAEEIAQALVLSGWTDAVPYENVISFDKLDKGIQLGGKNSDRKRLYFILQTSSKRKVNLARDDGAGTNLVLVYVGDLE